MDIKSSKPVPVSDAKEILAKRDKDGELGYEQSQALENAERFANPDKTAKTIKALAKNEKISEELAAKIADVRPTKPATLKALLVKDRVELSDEEVDSVLKELA
jgi:DNA-directed RNA polymerase subunit F